MRLASPPLIVGVLLFVALYSFCLAVHSPGRQQDSSNAQLHSGSTRKVLLNGFHAWDNGETVTNSEAAGGDSPHSLLSKSTELLSGGRYELFNGAETVWQLPPADKPRKGVLFIAHGCNHGAIDWWPQSASCPQCIGLPEEMNVTLHSLLRGYAVVAVSSVARRGSRCWQTPFGGGDPADYSEAAAAPSNDYLNVQHVLSTLLPREGLSSLPLLALGASSGGAFVLGLPSLMPGAFAGLAVQIMGGPPGLLAQYRSLGHTAAWPPTLFAHMPRDSHMAALVEANLAEMRQAGVPAHELLLLPRPLTPLYLVQRCAPEVDERTSRAIYEAFRRFDFIDERGFLRHNPRGPPLWQHLLRLAELPGLERLRLRPEESPIAEELNLLFAGHELSSETTTDMLNWFESRIAAAATAGEANAGG